VTTTHGTPAKEAHNADVMAKQYRTAMWFMLKKMGRVDEANSRNSEAVAKRLRHYYWERAVDFARMATVNQRLAAYHRSWTGEHD